jgi:hypothetical protein
LLGEGGEVDGGGKGYEFEMAGDGGATDSGERPAKDEFEGFAFDFWSLKVVSQIVKNSLGDFGSKGPSEMTGLVSSFLDREDEPVLAESCRRAPGDNHEGKSVGDGFFSGHRDF